MKNSMFTMIISAKGNEQRFIDEMGITIDEFNEIICETAEEHGFKKIGPETYELPDNLSIVGAMLEMDVDIAQDYELFPMITKWESDDEEDGHIDWLPNMKESYDRLYNPGKK